MRANGHVDGDGHPRRSRSLNTDGDRVNGAMVGLCSTGEIAAATTCKRQVGALGNKQPVRAPTRCLVKRFPTQGARAGVVQPGWGIGDGSARQDRPCLRNLS